MKNLSKKMKITIGAVVFVLFCVIISPFIKGSNDEKTEPAQTTEQRGDASADLVQEPETPDQEENQNIGSGGVNKEQSNATEEPGSMEPESQGVTEAATYNYDELQTLFLELTRDTTPDELDGYIEKYSLEYTVGEYTSSSGKEIQYCIAYTEGAAAQKYADSGDHLEVTFGGDSKDDFMYAEYVSAKSISYSAILYDHGTFWDFRDNNAEDYSGYYINDSLSGDTGIAIKYTNGNEAKTNYFPCASGEEAIQKVIDKTRESE